MLHHRRPTRGQDKHDGGGNVEEIEAVAARAANIQHGAREFRRVEPGIDGALHEQFNEAGNLFRTFAFGMQRGQEFRLGFIFHLI